MAEQLPHYRNLSVPFLSQRKNTYVFNGTYKDGGKSINLNYSDNGKVEVSMANRSCNITCVAMLLQYFGVTTDTPDKMMEDYFTSPEGTFRKMYSFKTVKSFESWEIMEDFVIKSHGTKCKPKLYGSNACTILELRKNIEAGYPVMMSFGINAEDASGHIVVVRGFTEIGRVEYIILNDPWGHVTKVDITTGDTWYPYDSGGDDGDNVVLKVDEFKKMIYKNGTIHRAMVIYASLWQYPDGTKIDTKDNEKTIENSGIIIKNEGFPIHCLSWHNGIHLAYLARNEISSIGAGRLLAVRNKQVANGSASFMLVQHKFAKIETTTESTGTTKLELGELLTFNALYMHTAYIPIEACATEYFTTGKLPDDYNFKWLLQLFSSMLPHTRVIANSNAYRLGGDLSTGSYKTQRIYNATVENNGLRRTASDPIDSSDSPEDLQENQFHGQRMLVHLLPANDLFQELLNPANYADKGFQKRMLNPSNFFNKVTTSTIIDGEPKLKTAEYMFFHNSNANMQTPELGIFCSKKNDNFFQTLSNTVNKRAFERNAKKLSQLYKKEVVSFDDLVNVAVDSDITPTKYLDSKASSFFNGYSYGYSNGADITFADLSTNSYFLTNQRAHWNTRFDSRKMITNITTEKNTEKTTVSFHGTASLSLTDNFFTVIEDIYSELSFSYIDKKDCSNTICKMLNTYFYGAKGYKKRRKDQLLSSLEKLIQLNDAAKAKSEAPPQNAAEAEAQAQAQLLENVDWKAYLGATFDKCLEKMNTEWGLGLDTTEIFAKMTSDGHERATAFVDKLEELNLSPGYAEIAIEIVCCTLCNIPRNKITGNSYFEIGDDCITTLLNRYSELLKTDFESFTTSCQHYVDTFIEISKNDVIGKGGNYATAGHMIHFEIFSTNEDKNIYEKLADTDADTVVPVTIVDSEPKSFFMPSHIIKILKKIKKDGGVSYDFDYPVENVLTVAQCTEINESNIFLKHAVQHISEWSPKLNYQCFHANYEGDSDLHDVCIMEQTDEGGTIQHSHNEIFNTEKLFEKCMVPYYWRLDSKKWKTDFPGDVCTFYHPFYFLQQINKNDEKSLTLHKP